MGTGGAVAHAPEGEGKRIYLIDGHPVTRAGLSALLQEQGHFICGEAESPVDGPDGVLVVDPDLVIFDPGGLGERSVPLTQGLLGARDGLPLLAYAATRDLALVRAVLAAGVLGCVSKEDEVGALLRAVDATLKGVPYVSESFGTRLAAAGGMAAALAALAPRERQVYDRLGQGYRTREIARQLGLSHKTVESYYDRLKEKLGFAGVPALQRQAIRDRQARPEGS